jgi:hypothetical protein
VGRRPCSRRLRPPRRFSTRVLAGAGLGRGHPPECLHRRLGAAGEPIPRLPGRPSGLPNVIMPGERVPWWWLDEDVECAPSVGLLRTLKAPSERTRCGRRGSRAATAAVGPFARRPPRARGSRRSRVRSAPRGGEWRRRGAYPLSPGHTPAAWTAALSGSRQPGGRPRAGGGGFAACASSAASGGPRASGRCCKRCSQRARCARPRSGARGPARG